MFDNEFWDEEIDDEDLYPLEDEDYVFLWEYDFPDELDTSHAY